MTTMDASARSRSTVFIVDDNDDILLNLRILLDFSEYNATSARNGKEALETLRKLRDLPDVIISDIMMPEMNGYDLFKAVSTEPRLNQIPFIFLSAKSTPDDIRLGKILGADDYLTKPFNQEDLIAIIQGKIARKKRTAQINNAIGASMQENCMDQPPSDKTNVCLLYVVWDDKIGPVTRDCYPRQEAIPFNVQEIGYQLFNASSAIYGDKFSANAEGILLALVNIKQQAYVFFDSYPDRSKRAGVVLYMIALIAPCVSYLASLSIRKVFEDLTDAVKQKKPISLAKYQERILSGLS